MLQEEIGMFTLPELPDTGAGRSSQRLKRSSERFGDGIENSAHGSFPVAGCSHGTYALEFCQPAGMESNSNADADAVRGLCGLFRRLRTVRGDEAACSCHEQGFGASHRKAHCAAWRLATTSLQRPHV